MTITRTIIWYYRHYILQYMNNRLTSNTNRMEEFLTRLRNALTLDDVRLVLQDRDHSLSMALIYQEVCARQDVRYFELIRQELIRVPSYSLDRNAPVNLLSLAIDEATILQGAFSQGHVDVVIYFFNLGLKANQLIDYIYPLTLATKNKRVDMVDVILEHHKCKVGENHTDILYLKTCMMPDAVKIACENDSVDIIQRFYLYGADFTRLIKGNFVILRGEEIPGTYILTAMAYHSLNVLEFFEGLGLISNDLFRELTGTLGYIHYILSDDDYMRENSIRFLRRCLEVATLDVLYRSLTYAKKFKRDKVIPMIEEYHRRIVSIPDVRKEV